MRLWDIISSFHESWPILLSEHFSRRYGDRITKAIRDVRSKDEFEDDIQQTDPLGVYDEPWLTRDYKCMLSTLSNISKDDILLSLHSIPCHLRPSYSTRSTRACRSSLLSHIRSRISYLGSLSSQNFGQVFFCVLPFHTECDLSRSALTERVLIVEYGSLIISNLRTSFPSKNQERDQRRQNDRELLISNALQTTQEISSAWPQKVLDDIVFECLENYRVQTIWVPPLICSVCGLERKHVEDVVLFNEQNSPLDFSLLHVKDLFISDLSSFQYGFDAINNSIFDNAGLKTSHDGSLAIQICKECLFALKHKRIHQEKGVWT